MDSSNNSGFLLNGRGQGNGRRVTSLSVLPLKTRRVGGTMLVNSVEAQTPSRWWGAEVRRGGCQLRYRPRYLTMVQNDEVHCEKPSSS
ncbi:hypothetical protein TNCV_2375521 [Trichonephila clavipes]|nr:hypothetical protein TNCV_2375521 [Trichonephila clavipes]